MFLVMEAKQRQQASYSETLDPGNIMKFTTNALFGLALVGMAACGTPVAKADRGTSSLRRPRCRRAKLFTASGRSVTA